MLINEPICFFFFDINPFVFKYLVATIRVKIRSTSTSADRFLSITVGTADDVANYRMEYFLDTSPDF